MFDQSLIDEAAKLVAECARRDIMLATAESCTGGLLAALLTEIPGSSAVVDRGFVTYSNEAKMAMLGVPAEILQAHGAVSEQTAIAMARGAVRNSRAEIAAAITGIAGPAGGSAEKPVGLVHIACGHRSGRLFHTREQFEGSRREIRLRAVQRALAALSAQATFLS